MQEHTDRWTGQKPQTCRCHPPQACPPCCSLTMSNVHKITKPSRNDSFILACAMACACLSLSIWKTLVMYCKQFAPDAFFVWSRDILFIWGFFISLQFISTVRNVKQINSQPFRIRSQPPPISPAIFLFPFVYLRCNSVRVDAGSWWIT